MAEFSARLIYIIIASAIILLFIGTGAFYIFNIKQQNNKQAEVFLSEEEPQATPTPTPHTSKTKCFESCEFTFQCEDDLECMEIENKNFCVNNKCPTNTSCDCTQTVATASALPVATASGNVLPKAASTPKPTPKVAEVFNQEEETDVSEEPPTETEEYDPSLPTAGNEFITLLVLGLGVIGIGTGFVLKKIKA